MPDVTHLHWTRLARAVPVLPLVLGITDGILNALTLAGGAILRSADGVSVSLALRVGCAALITAAFTMFIADYAERRAQLVRASRQLNLTEPGRLATTRLGRQAARESAIAMLVAAVASLIGATAPLLVGEALPGPSWLVLVLTVLALGLLGWILATILVARRWRWAALMTIGGAAVAAIGVLLGIT